LGDFPAGRRQMTSWSSKAVGTFYTPASRWHYQLRSGLTPWNLGAGGENSTLKSKLESLLTLLYSKVAGKFLTEMKGFDGKIICKWWIFHCHSWVPEGFWFLFWGSVGVSHPGKSGAASKQVSSLTELRPCSDFDLMISKDRNHTLELRGIGISAAVASQNMGFTSNLLHFGQDNHRPWDGTGVPISRWPRSEAIDFWAWDQWNLRSLIIEELTPCGWHPVSMVLGPPVEAERRETNLVFQKARIWLDASSFVCPGMKPYLNDVLRILEIIQTCSDREKPHNVVHNGRSVSFHWTIHWDPDPLLMNRSAESISINQRSSTII